MARAEKNYRYVWISFYLWQKEKRKKKKEVLKSEKDVSKIQRS